MLDGLRGNPEGRPDCDYLIVASEGEAETLMGRFAEGGSAARRWSADAVSEVPDLAGLGALVLDGDLCGGVTEALALAGRILGAGPRLPIVILLAGLSEQIFPTTPKVDPVLLRKPLSRLTARITRDYLESLREGIKANGAQPSPVRPV